MTDFFAAPLKLHKQMLDAQRASLAAGARALGAGRAAKQMQETAHKMAQANIAAMAMWARLWGVGK
ncbi:MAG: hypothetical protein ACKVOB_03485 [Sphingomonas sp.]